MFEWTVSWVTQLCKGDRSWKLFLIIVICVYVFPVFYTLQNSLLLFFYFILLFYSVVFSIPKFSSFLSTLILVFTQINLGQNWKWRRDLLTLYLKRMQEIRGRVFSLSRTLSVWCLKMPHLQTGESSGLCSYLWWADHVHW